MREKQAQKAVCLHGVGKLLFRCSSYASLSLSPPLFLPLSPIVSGTSCPKDCLSVTWLPAEHREQGTGHSASGRRMRCPMAAHNAAGNDNSANAPGNSTVKSYSNFKCDNTMMLLLAKGPANY